MRRIIILGKPMRRIFRWGEPIWWQKKIVPLP